MVRGGIILIAMLASATGAASVSARECVELTQGTLAGDFIGEAQARNCPCRDDAPPAPLGFDRSVGAPYAAADLPAGTYLGPLALRPGPVFAVGAELRIAFRSGPVAIEREVRLLAPARGGERALARAQDGTVFSARLIASTPAESGL
jgi:hypothetical protein